MSDAWCGVDFDETEVGNVYLCERKIGHRGRHAVYAQARRLDYVDVLEDKVEQLRSALNLMLQAFDPAHPAACHQDCFDTSDGHGYEVQESAKRSAWAAIAASGQEEPGA